MLGTMMQRPLSIPALLEHAARCHGDTEIVTRTTEGPIHRYGYAEALQRSKQLANALIRLGAHPNDRIATLAWNTHRHFELYYAISGIGAIVHTLNPRLFVDQLAYIINHAADRYLFVDLTFLPIVEQLAERIPTVLELIVLTDRAHMPTHSHLPRLHCYEELLAAENSQFNWPTMDENRAAALCYTSGTTGHPKGVLYSHRSTLLHALTVCQRQVLDLSADTAVLPAVPMFHVCAWGMPYAAPLGGAKLILPGPALDGASLARLIHDEGANLLLGVPTLWLDLLNHLRAQEQRLDGVERVVIGGAAAPYSMIKEFDERHGVFVVHAWGMTETSPIGTLNSPTPQMRRLPAEARYRQQMKQGRPPFGVEIRIVNDAGEALPEDGKTFGRLLVRGPWVANGYFRSEERNAFVNGWFDTGDIATIDPSGTMQIVDRAKDVIKSGGEWISSIELENLAIGHPAVKEACVVGVPHPKWDERPLLLLVLQPQAQLTEAEMLSHLQDKVAKWWLPDRVIIVDTLPHGSTGKLQKNVLREQYQQLLLKG